MERTELEALEKRIQAQEEMLNNLMEKLKELQESVERLKWQTERIIVKDALAAKERAKSRLSERIRELWRTKKMQTDTKS